jgi:methanogenic corrinoid protein MtbC1
MIKEAMVTRKVLDGSAEDASEARLTIGALSRATGIPVETLRTWENRYGYPVPERKPSGHRVYPISAVARLKRIALALAAGHRPAQAVNASDAELDQLLGASRGVVERPRLVEPPTPSAPAAPAAVSSASTDELLNLVERFDAERLTRALMADWAALDPVAFLETRIAPLVRAVGEAWAEGRAGIRHEHFLSERVGDLLRTLRLRLDEGTQGAPRVVLATLPGEAHELGLQMAALAVAASGCQCVYLGAEVPPAEIADVARVLEARAVGVSVSVANQGPGTTAGLKRLRAMLPPRTELWVGGDGAPGVERGVERVSSLRQLKDRTEALLGS